MRAKMNINDSPTVQFFYVHLQTTHSILHLPSYNSLPTTSNRLLISTNRLQVSLSLKTLQDTRLLIQHKSIRLTPNLRQTSPPLKVLCVALVPVRSFRLLPVSLAECKQSGDGLLGNVVDEGTDCSGFWEVCELSVVYKYSHS